MNNSEFCRTVSEVEQSDIKCLFNLNLQILSFIFLFMKKILFIIFMIFGIVVMLSCENKLTYKSVSMKDGISLMEKTKDFILLDVRRIDEFEAGHIPGAVLFTNEEITKEKAEKLLPNKNQQIFVYCRSGRRSKEASQKLVSFGYSNIIEIGGIIDYKGKIEY